jgi:hypothetical protein
MRIILFEDFNGKNFATSVKDCFQDLIDDGRANIVTDYSDDFDITIEVILNTYEIDTNSFDKFVNQHQLFNQELQEIYSVVQRVKEDYTDDFDLSFEYVTNSDDTITLFLCFSEALAPKGDFYKLNPDGVSIDRDELKKILNLPKSCTFGHSVGSNSERFRIYFSNPELLDEYQKDVIEKMSNLKVGTQQLLAPTTWDFAGKNKDTYKVFKNHDTGNSRYTSILDLKHFIDFSINPELKLSYY